MLTGLDWLALEAKYLEVAGTFYEETFGINVSRARGGRTRLHGGRHRSRAPPTGGAPAGGLHTHFAFSIPAAEYDDWWDRLDDNYDLEEARFGPSRSLYLYDPDGNCVELGQQDVTGPGIDGIFEVVLEVADLERAQAFYEDLGFETVDEGDDRKRVRLHGPMALELWGTHLRNRRRPRRRPRRPRIRNRRAGRCARGGAQSNRFARAGVERECRRSRSGRPLPNVYRGVRASALRNGEPPCGGARCVAASESETRLTLCEG